MPDAPQGSPLPTAFRPPDAAAPRMVLASNPLALYLELARLHIAWGIRLTAAINARELELFGEGGVGAYNVPELMEVLTNQSRYEQMLLERDVFSKRNVDGEGRTAEPPDPDMAPFSNTREITVPGLLLDGAALPSDEWEPGMRELDATLRHFKLRYWALKEHLVFVQTIIRNALEAYPDDGMEQVRADFNLQRLQSRMAETLRADQVPGALPPGLPTSFEANRQTGDTEHTRLRPIDSFALYVNYARINIAWGVRLAEAIHTRQLEIYDAAYCDKMGLPAPMLAANSTQRPPIRQWTAENIVSWLVFRDDYENGLVAMQVYLSRESVNTEDGEDDDAPLRQPGPLLRGNQEPRSRWTRGLYFLDAAIRHLKAYHWGLPNESGEAVRALIQAALSTYHPATPLAQLAKDFRLEDVQKAVFAVLNADWLA